MRKPALFVSVAALSGMAASSVVEQNVRTPEVASAVATATQARPSVQQIDAAIAEWRSLRRDNRPSFERAARFAIAYADWPEVGVIRSRAEASLDARANDAQVIEFFRSAPPSTARGWTQLALAYDRQGRNIEALAAARSAWTSADLSSSDEAMLRGQYWSRLTAADHARRVDSLLFDNQASRAAAYVSTLSPDERAVAEARIALQRADGDAERKFALVADRIDDHAGLLMDRARYFRTYGNETAAQSLLAQPHQFQTRPTNIDKWYEMLLLAAQGAQSRGDYTMAFNIARQLDDAYAPGDDRTLQPYGVRDKYTDLAWLAGTVARERLRRPAAASTMFELYSGGGRSLQVRSKGLYWAGRSALEAGDQARANALFSQAATSPELFYSQLALERLGREIPVPADLPAQVDPALTQEFYARPIVSALPRLANSRSEQALFVRALAESLESEGERVLGSRYAATIDRPDLGVWIARIARNNGTPFYYKSAWPTHPAGVPGGQLWSYAHGITRQESSFDRTAVSHANAHGMMQLLPGTAQDQARRSGIGYDYGRLLSDPAYNVRLGSDYLALRLRNWDGNLALAAASYNAGHGNAMKWVRRYGDPRDPGVDTLSWIENIPFSETRSYVQRVVENAAVYDRLNPYVPAYGAVHVSRHLGKPSRPG